MIACPAAARKARGARVRPERFGAREHDEAAIARKQLERRAEQRRVVLSRDQVAVAIGGAAGADECHVGLGQPAADDELAQDKCEAGGHRVDRQRATLETSDVLDARTRHDGKEPAVATHEREQVRIVGDLRLTLSFLISDQVIDRRQRDVEFAVEQRGDQECRGGRVGELHRNAVRFEEALPLRGP